MKKFVSHLPRYKKAIVGFIAPGLTIVGVELVSGGWPDAIEWRTALIVCVATALGVAFSPANAGKREAV